MTHSSPGRPSLLQLSEEARYPHLRNEGPIGRAIGGALGTAAGAIVPPLLGYHAGAMAGEPFTGMLDAPPDAGGPGGAVLGALGSFPGGKFGGAAGAHIGDKVGDAIGNAAKWAWRGFRRSPKPPEYEPVVRRLRDDERKSKPVQEPSFLDDGAPLPPVSLVPPKPKPPKPLPYEVVPDDEKDDSLDLNDPEHHEEGPDVYDRVNNKFDLRKKDDRNTLTATGAFEDEVRKWHAAGETPQAIALRLQDAGLAGATVKGVERFLQGRGEDVRPAGDKALRTNADAAFAHVQSVHSATRLSRAAQRELFKRELERAGHVVAFDDQLSSLWANARSRHGRRNKKAAIAPAPAAVDSAPAPVSSEWSSTSKMPWFSTWGLTESVSHRRTRAAEWGV